MNEQQNPSENEKNIPRNPSNPIKKNESGSNQDQTRFNEKNGESYESEINPSKFDKSEVNLDQGGVSNTKGHEPYEFKGKDIQSENQANLNRPSVNPNPDVHTSKH
jgi:hypothetical protein